MAHRVYMRFERMLGRWRVSFRPMSACDVLRECTFADSEKVEQLAFRGGALRDLAAKQALETAIRSGFGGIDLSLSPDQYSRLRLPAKKSAASARR